MAEETKKTTVEFGAKDSMTPFMKQVASEAKKMYSIFADEAKKQFQSAKEQNKYIQDRLKLMKEELRMQKELANEERKRAREAFNDAVKDNDKRQGEYKKKWDEAEDKHKEASGKYRSAGFANSYKEEDKKPSVFSSVVAAGVFRDLMALARQVPSAQTGLDLVSPAAGIAGSMAGAAVGAPLLASAAGAQIGKDVAMIAGDMVIRSLRVQDQYNRANLSFKALGGNEAGMGLAGAGFDSPAVMEAMVKATQASGTAGGASGGGGLALMLSRLGWSDEGTSMAALGMGRSGGGSGQQNMQRALGTAIAEGLDKARFSDAIKSQTQLMQHFAMTSTNVSSTDANRAMFEFNRMGGAFSIGDPRAMSNMMKIDQGLSNPSDPFQQAQNYAVLRQLNPGASPWELKKMEAKGMQTPGFLSGIMNQIAGTGASEDLQKFMFQSRTGLAGDFVDTIFNKGSGAIGSMTQEQLNKELGMKDTKSAAEDFTSRLTKEQAAVTDAFRQSAIAGATEIKNQFVDRMKDAITEVSDFWKSSMGESGEGRVAEKDLQKYFPGHSAKDVIDAINKTYGHH